MGSYKIINKIDQYIFFIKCQNGGCLFACIAIKFVYLNIYVFYILLELSTFFKLIRKDLLNLNLNYPFK